MKPESILETILYANSLEEAAWFYHEVLGLDMPRDRSELAVLFRVDDNHVLLVFDPKKSDQPGRPVPSHGARGPGHIALRIRPQDYQSWIEQFVQTRNPHRTRASVEPDRPGKIHLYTRSIGQLG